MSLISRLNKLEKSFGLNTDSPFCGCQRTTGETYLQMDGETEAKLISDELPINCEMCGKEIDKQTVIIVGVNSAEPDSNTVLVYGSKIYQGIDWKRI